MRILPTFTDTRLSKTINVSIQALENDIGIMIYPEDSNDGYKDVLTKFFPGFVLLAQKYYKVKGEDLPIYPVYYHDAKRIIVIDKPDYCQRLMGEGMDKNQIADYFCTKVNDLFYRCENGEFDKV